MTETQAITSFLSFIQSEIEKVDEGEKISSKHVYTNNATALTEGATVDIDLDEYIECIFRAKANDEDDDMVEYLQELADIFEGMLDE